MHNKSKPRLSKVFGQTGFVFAYGITTSDKIPKKENATDISSFFDGFW